MTFHVPNQFRLRKGEWRSDDGDGNNGVFFVPNRAGRMRALSTREATAVPLKVIASDHKQPGFEPDPAFGDPWEHVSVSLPNRCPTWEEMCFIKGVFWDLEDCVVQFHPPESTYVNNHPYCLHLWRKPGYEFPMPSPLTVGIAT